MKTIALLAIVSVLASFSLCSCTEKTVVMTDDTTGVETTAVTTEIVTEETSAEVTTEEISEEITT